ncbi:NAD(P)H-binding protein [Streptomyces sp. NPDC057253]|uniref:NmrA family NAD(P)-binding protein n=1 Tax=Streptomyces sp. NPDC057253 TaxID=3346069 RepID=UPI0036335FC8
MLIVTGATGQLGALVVERLLERVPAGEVGVSVRDPERAADLAARGVRVRAADFTEPDGLKEAFEGAERVLIVSTAIRDGATATAANIAAVDAARDAGAERILYTSHQAASPTSLFPPMRVHAATEKHLEQLGVPFTALRNGFYAATLRSYVGTALETGTLAVPQDGPVSWTAHEDLADAAVAALTEDTPLDGITPPLTAPHTLDFAEVAAILGRTTGRTVTRVVMDDAAWTSTAVTDGMPRPLAEFLLTMFTAAREGEFAVTNPALETTVGHPARTVQDLVEAVVGSR